MTIYILTMAENYEIKKFQAAHTTREEFSSLIISTKVCDCFLIFSSFLPPLADFFFLLFKDLLGFGDSASFSNPGLDLARKLSQQILTFLPNSLPDSLAESAIGTVVSGLVSSLFLLIPIDCSLSSTSLSSSYLLSSLHALSSSTVFLCLGQWNVAPRDTFLTALMVLGISRFFDSALIVFSSASLGMTLSLFVSCSSSFDCSPLVLSRLIPSDSSLSRTSSSNSCLQPLSSSMVSLCLGHSNVSLTILVF